MNYLAIYDNVTGKRRCFLENAYNIGYALMLNQLDTATFSLPGADPKNQYCTPYSYVDIWDGDDFVGLFRILPYTSTREGETREVVYTCESVLATLMDDVLFGWHEIGNIGVFTTEVLSYVLSKQTTERWQLNQCQFSRQFLYGWENENLLSALFSVPKPFVESYQWKLDTTALPWQLSLLEVNDTPKADVRYRKNMKGMTKSVNPTNLCTRIYPLGYGEGVNQLTIEAVNDGVPYLDAPSIVNYGVIARIWVDRRYQDADSLLGAAQAQLDALSTPYVTYETDIVHTPQLKECKCGDFVRVVDDEDNIDFLAQIIKIEKKDVIGDNANATITLSNKAQDVATTMADMADRTRINETYAQGAVTVFTKSFADNCSPDYPAVMRFPIPSNVVHINEVILSGGTTPFRAYSKAIEGGGSTTTTTDGGGAFYTTSSSGGGSTETSSETTLESETVQSDGNSGPGTAKHNHGMSDGLLLLYTNSESSLTPTGCRAFVPSGAHIHTAHSHDVDIPEHEHDIEVDDHTHDITLPDHTHEIEYGIYQGGTANALTLIVDGEEVGVFNSFNDINIIPYLSKNDGGQINRSWHTVEIQPNSLTRVEVDLAIQLFANSRGGGQY